MKKIVRLTERDLEIIVRRVINEAEVKKEEPKKENTKMELPKNIIIGDSQCPWIAKKSKKFDLISKEGGMKSLWMNGKGLSWLKGAIESHSGSKNVKNIAICIGTNGGFNAKDDIRGLIVSIRDKFPNAKLFAIQGSWGWGGNKNKTDKDIKDYYSKFTDNRVKVIEPAIGKNEPHQDLLSYSKIAINLDNNPLLKEGYFRGIYESETSKKKAR